MKDGVGVIFLVVKPLGVYDGLHRFVGLLREKVVSVHVTGILLYHFLVFSVVGLKFFILLNGIIIDRWNTLAGCIELKSLDGIPQVFIGLHPDVLELLICETADRLRLNNLLQYFIDAKVSRGINP